MPSLLLALAPFARIIEAQPIEDELPDEDLDTHGVSSEERDGS